MKKFKRFMLKLLLFIIFQTVVLIFADEIKDKAKTEFNNIFGDVFMIENQPDDSVQPIEVISNDQPNVVVSQTQQIPESFEVNVPIFGKITGNIR